MISAVGTVDSSGNLTVMPPATTTYVCVAVSNNPSVPDASLWPNLQVTVTQPSSGGGTPQGSGVCKVNIDFTMPSSPMTTCQTIYRINELDLSEALSDPNQPITCQVVSEQIKAAVLTQAEPGSPIATVQLSTLFGDYFFDVTLTDSRGRTTKARVDLQFAKTTVR